MDEERVDERKGKHETKILHLISRIVRALLLSLRCGGPASGCQMVKRRSVAWQRTEPASVNIAWTGGGIERVVRHTGGPRYLIGRIQEQFHGWCVGTKVSYL